MEQNCNLSLPELEPTGFKSFPLLSFLPLTFLFLPTFRLIHERVDVQSREQFSFPREAI